MSVNSKMTAIADKTRELVGVTGRMGLDEMADNLGTAVDACDSQSELIRQIKKELANKVAGAAIPEAATAEFGREKIVETAPEGKAFYNGVLLPVFPAAGFEQCPYLLILQHTEGNIFAYGSTSVPYFTYRNTAKSLELPAGRNRCPYDPATDSWGEVQSSTSGTWCDLSESWSIIWTNFDVPKNSATGTDIYFKATVPEELATGYGEYVSGSQQYAVVGENLDELAHRMQLEYSTYDLFTGEEIREYVMNPPAVDNTPVVEKDINFWDYDGTLLHSYALEELPGLTELPPGFEHEGLIFDGWNWTLDQLKEQNTKMNVGACYQTKDGATWFVLDNGTNEPVEESFTWTNESGVTVVLDFGDGETYTNSTAGVQSVSHSYAPGQYTAKLFGKVLPGNGSTTCMNDMPAGGSRLLKRLHLNVESTRNYAFYKCINLEAVSVPQNYRVSGVQIFAQCSNLKFLTVTTVNTGIGSGAFNNCFRMQNIALSYGLTGLYASPPYVKSLYYSPKTTVAWVGTQNNYAVQYIIVPPNDDYGASTFRNCSSLLEFTVTEDVTKIGTHTFNGCSSLMKFKFCPAVPPAVAASTAFTGIPTTCIVEVPAESLEAYQNATNYASIAAQMVGV